ncbi:MAG: hypothetical protein R3C19_14135 [Planctomycetaceae bacterium]
MKRLPAGTVAAISIAALLVCGCTTARSTMLFRDPGNTQWQQDKTTGYPITLRVPTHIKVEIVEKLYLVDAGSRGVRPAVDEQNNVFRSWDFRTQILETDKVFTVDYKRPVAGTLNYNTNLSPDQSIEVIQNRLADDAIAQIGVAVSNTLQAVTVGGTQADFSFTNVGSGGTFPTATGQNAKGERPSAIANSRDELSGDNILPVTNVVAAKVFAIDDADFELQVHQFLECGLGVAGTSLGL